MSESFLYQSPQIIKYGLNAFERLGKESASRGRKALIISDKVMDSLGYVDRCRNILSSRGVDSECYLGVTSEPTDKYVAQALDLLHEEACDVIISLGGGSCIDTAKAVAVVATNGGYIGDYVR